MPRRANPQTYLRLSVRLWFLAMMFQCPVGLILKPIGSVSYNAQVEQLVSMPRRANPQTYLSGLTAQDIPGTRVFQCPVGLILKPIFDCIGGARTMVRFNAP